MNDQVSTDTLTSESPTFALTSNVLSGNENLHGPLWFRKIREQAKERAYRLPFPSRHEEAWRKIPLDSIDLSLYKLVNHHSKIEVVSTNDVVVLPLEKALNDEDLAKKIRTHIEAELGQKDKNVFVQLHYATLSNGAVISVKNGCYGTVDIIHDSDAGSSLTHHTIVFADANSELTLVEHYRGASNDHPLFMNPSVSIYAGEGAKINYIAVRYHRNEVSFSRMHTEQKRNSNIHCSMIQIGGAVGKHSIHAGIQEEGASFRAIGVGAFSHHQFCDMDWCVDHNAGHTESSLLYRAVVRDHAHSLFNGNLNIPHKLSGICSHQLNNNILIHKTARAESMPRLVIKSEGVSCEHGATVGELDEEALFFLAARGVPPNEARAIMLEGFLTTLVHEIPLSDKHDEFLDMLKKKIDTDEVVDR